MGLFSYPHQPGAKTPGTSTEAAEKIAPRASVLRDRVERLFLTGATLTADECAEALDISILSARPRVAELVAKGLVVDTGERRRNTSGRAATVWRAA